MYNATVYIYTDYDSKSASNEISPSNNINVLCVKAISLKSYLTKGLLTKYSAGGQTRFFLGGRALTPTPL